jgi:hypothetical protein
MRSSRPSPFSCQSASWQMRAGAFCSEFASLRRGVHHHIASGFGVGPD